MERKNAWLSYDAAQKEKLNELCERYKTFITCGKTERECVDQAVEAGTEFDALAGVSASDKEDGDVSGKIVITSMPDLTFQNGKVAAQIAGNAHVAVILNVRREGDGIAV